MASLIEEPISVELGATEPWPDNVCLFQPYEAKQILLPDAAACVCVRTFLNMCGLKYTIELRTNAENMSPSGKVPFMKIGPFLISELDPIIAFVNTKGHHLSESLDDAQKAEMRAYMSLVDNVLVNAELYLTWCEESTLSEVTRTRFGSPYPWPLNIILPWKRQMEVRSKLKAIGWSQKTFEEVCEEVRTCCSALSERLGNQPFFFGNHPCELDAVVFAHCYIIRYTTLPRNEFANIINGYPNLTDFVVRINNLFYMYGYGTHGNTTDDTTVTKNELDDFFIVNGNHNNDSIDGTGFEQSITENGFVMVSPTTEAIPRLPRKRLPSCENYKDQIVLDYKRKTMHLST